MGGSGAGTPSQQASVIMIIRVIAGECPSPSHTWPPGSAAGLV